MKTECDIILTYFMYITYVIFIDILCNAGWKRKEDTNLILSDM